MPSKVFSLQSHSRCSYDYVKVIDGDGSTLMDKACGSTRPTSFKTNTNRADVVFHSDGSVTRSGFRITWESTRLAPSRKQLFSSAHLEMSCLGSTSETTGVVTSERYPSYYPNNLDKSYPINVPTGQTIQITFTSFYLEVMTMKGWSLPRQTLPKTKII